MIELQQIFEDYYIQYYLYSDESIDEDIQDGFDENFKIHLKEQNKKQLIDYYEKYYDEDNIYNKELICILKLMKNQEIKLNQSQGFILDQRLKLLYCKQYNINKTNKINNKFQNNDKRNTIAMWLTQNQCLIPKQWMHNPSIQNKYGYTVAMYQASQGHLPSKQWLHNKYLRCKYQNNDQIYYYTVQNFLQQNHINIPDEWKYNVLNDNDDNQAMIDARNCIIQELGDNDSLERNINGDTVAIILTQKEILPPKQWMHDIDLENSSHQSIKSILQQRQLPVPHHWNQNDMNQFDQAIYKQIPDINGHNPEEQDQDGFTVAMILLINKMAIPGQWHHDLNIRNKYNQTLFDICLKYKIQPQQWFCKTANWQDTNRNTQAMLLAHENIDIPQFLYHDPTMQNKEDYTVALLLLQQNIMPPKKWIHDLNITSITGESIKSLLQKNNLPIPKYCDTNEMTIFDQACFKIIPKINNHKLEEQNEDGQTVAMILAYNNVSIPEQWQHKPELQDNEGKTVAIIQALQGKIPDKQWQHNKYLRYKYEYHDQYFKHYQFYTVQNILQSKNIEVPDEWKYTPLNEHEDSQAMIDISQRLTPQLEDNDPSYQNIMGKTAAMLFASQKIIPPKEWQHNPNLQDYFGNTVAIILSRYGIIPPRRWMYDINLQNNNRNSIKHILQRQFLPLPYNWHKNDMTIFDKACFNQKLTIKQQNSNEQDPDGFTVAMILSSLNKPIPKQYYHNTSIQNKYGFTVAMYQAQHGKIPANRYYHDPLICNCNYDTVAILLAKHGIIPPKKWIHDINQQNNKNQSIKSLLYSYNYIYKNNQFILNCKTHILNDLCVICLNQSEQEFLETKCEHKICIDCFKQLVQNKHITRCPVCLQQNWYEQIED